MHTACPMLQEMPLKIPHSFNSLGGGMAGNVLYLNPLIHMALCFQKQGLDIMSGMDLVLEMFSEMCGRVYGGADNIVQLSK